MASILWRFVDQPVANPTTILDMNRGDGSIVIDMDAKFDISPPKRKASFASNSMVDGSLMTSSAFENRILEFTLGIQGTVEQQSQALANLNASLAQESLLMYSPSPGVTPVFFRTMRSDEYTLANRGGRAGAWRVSCQVLAEPFAISPRVDLVSGAVVTNDPAAVTNGCKLDLTGIVGDAPSPAFVRISNLGSGNPMFISQRSRKATVITPHLQAEAMTLAGGDVVYASAASNVSGPASPANNMAVASFTVGQSNTPAMVRFLGNFSSSDSTAWPGQYRVLARVSSDVEGATFGIRQILPQGNDREILGKVVTVVLGPNSWKLLDLGLFSWPPHEAPQKIGYSNLPPGLVSFQGHLEIFRVTSSGSLRLDYMYLLPADERTCVVTQTRDYPSGYTILDGPNDMTYMMAPGTTPFGETRTVNNNEGLVPRIGGIPDLVPKMTNRWHILQESASVTTTKTFDVSYWPRWYEVTTP